MEYLFILGLGVIVVVQLIQNQNQDTHIDRLLNDNQELRRKLMDTRIKLTKANQPRDDKGRRVKK